MIIYYWRQQKQAITFIIRKAYKKICPKYIIVCHARNMCAAW